MPTVEVIFDDLRRLVGLELPREVGELNELLSYAKGEVEGLSGDELRIEVKDGNRPDLWNVEGIARQLRGALGVEEGLKRYTVEAFSGVEIDVDPRLQTIRPYIASAVVEGVKLDDEAIREIIHLQDKLDLTYGRKRRRTSIGLYNHDLITPPLRYGASTPTEVSFIPLEGEEEMTLEEILERHPKGLEYGHIVKAHDLWPILVDSKDRVLSFPPIINSNDLGKITVDVENILIEVTGTVYETVLKAVTIVTLSLADRGERIYSVKVNYPYGEVKTDTTPRLENPKIRVETGYVNEVLGLDLDRESVVALLKKARYGVSQVGDGYIDVVVPCYRVDIMHPVDVVEDIAIMYGYNNIEPRWPQAVTFGGISEREAFSDLVREVMIGLGFQEILTFSMNNVQNLFDRMNLPRQRMVNISNPKTLRYTCLRSWLMPSLVEFLSSNTHVEYPQRVFEAGECVVFDNNSLTGTRDVTKLACLIIHSSASFSEAKAVLDALLLNLGIGYKLEGVEHGSFIEGRVGEILIGGRGLGMIGEISPKVLENWKLENPMVGFEIDLDKILEQLQATEPTRRI
ncbi:MAG: phenylalanine--tRNA ligase subunit beta [Candidatus Bathyarchaeia archaeon]